MTLIGIALLLGALALAVRWRARGWDGLGRERPFPTISVVLLAVLGVAALVPGILRARLEGRLAAAASSVVGVPVEVECQSFGKAMVDVGAEGGWVPYGPDGVPERKTLIKRDGCRALAAYLRSDKHAPSLEQVQAVHILTHESMHMSGITNEGETECFAVQRDAEMARLLGASDSDARALAATYWKNVYPRLSDTYRSAGCGPGGEFDAGLPDAPWEVATL